MPCTRPRQGWRDREGRVVFDASRAFNLSPLSIPCRQCKECRLAKSRDWMIRLVHESTLWTQNGFLTLTYNDEFLPADLNLVVEHWQSFAKRLRQARYRANRKHHDHQVSHQLAKFRYFAVGEYGEKNLRPHWHAIIFGEGFTQDRQLHKTTDHGNLYRSLRLDQLWGKGFCTVGSVTRKSAAYCARYNMKKLTGRLGDEHYKRTANGTTWTVRPEFAIMSNALGKGWLEKYRGDVFPADEVILDGKRFNVPEYYDKQLDDNELTTIKEKRKSKANNNRLTTEQLHAREVITDSKIKLLKRTI